MLQLTFQQSEAECILMLITKWRKWHTIHCAHLWCNPCTSVEQLLAYFLDE